MTRCACMIAFIITLLFNRSLYGQPKAALAAEKYQQVKTFVNPVLPGDHPDPTLLRVGDDFYHCGSSFHFTPYLPVYHSKDLVHWEIISRVVAPTKGQWITDRPSAGIWQGAITYFYGSYWIYFSANGQWFSKAASPNGPWTDAVQLQTNAVTGPLGYDNSIFIDDDGKPYMVIKNGQKTNRLQALGRDGQLSDTVINLDWINGNLQYSWAEGPVMCKRNGYYYYFPAGDVSGGQYVLRTKELTSDSTKWERLGDFFKPVTDAKVGFRRPNHIAAPLRLGDGTWWTIGQSYEKYNDDDWSGKGRQTSLYPVTWEGDRPWGMAPSTAAIDNPVLPASAILWRSVASDYFDTDSLQLCWHFLTKKDAGSYSLNKRKGWIRLIPDSGRTSIVQKETDHYFSAVTRVNCSATDTTVKAGLYLSNGNQTTFLRLYTGFEGGKQIVFRFDTAVRTIPNKFGNTVWLKIARSQHLLTGYCSGNGKNWVSMGAPISVVNLDKVQPNYNSWVGTSVGLFAEGKAADFDLFVCKDGFSAMPAIGYSNFYGIEKISGNNSVSSVTNNSAYGGWMMLSGVALGNGLRNAAAIELSVSALKAGVLEIWLDDLNPQHGKLIASIPVSSSNSENNFKTFRKTIKNASGHHDVFIKFPAGSERQLFVQSVRFVPSG